MVSGWEDGSVSKALPCKHEFLNSVPRTHVNSSVVVGTYNPSGDGRQKQVDLQVLLAS